MARPTEMSTSNVKDGFCDTHEAGRIRYPFSNVVVGGAGVT